MRHPGNPTQEPPGHSLVIRQGLHRPAHVLPLDLRPSPQIGGKEGTVAEHVDPPRHALRMVEDRPFRPGQKKRSPRPSRHAEAVMDVPRGLLPGQGQDLRTHGHPLVQLAQRRKGKLLLELLLPDQHDLEEFALLRLQVGEKADLFQQGGREVLRLVDDQHGASAAIRLGEKEPVQGIKAILLRAVGKAHAEIV